MFWYHWSLSVMSIKRKSMNCLKFEQNGCVQAWESVQSQEVFEKGLNWSETCSRVQDSPSGRKDRPGSVRSMTTNSSISLSSSTLNKSTSNKTLKSKKVGFSLHFISLEALYGILNWYYWVYFPAAPDYITCPGLTKPVILSGSARWYQFWLG